MRFGSRIRAFSLVFAVSAAACSGNGATTAPTAPAPTQIGQSVTGARSTIHIGTQPASVPIPSAGGFTGTLGFTAGSAQADISASATTTSPSTEVRKTLSSTATVFYSFTLTSPVTVTFSAIPAISLTFPTAPTAGQALYASVASAGQTSPLATDGPATVSGSTVTFPAVPEPFTLQAGTAYTFTIYGVPSASKPLLYVANPYSYSISVYDLGASGNASPIRTILGTTQTLDVYSMAVDKHGVLWVLYDPGPSMEVAAYAPDANGRAVPIHSYPLPNTVADELLGAAQAGGALTLTPDETGFVVGTITMTPGIGAQDMIATYSTSNGALQRSFLPGGMNYCVLNCTPPTAKGTFFGIGFNRAGNILAADYLSDRANLSDGVGIYPGDASTSDPTVVTQPLGFLNGPQPAPYEVGAFTHNAGKYAWARGVPPPDTRNEVDVYEDTGGGTLEQHLTGPNTLLDDKIRGVALAANGTVYVSSTSGFVNVYAPNATENTAPIRRITGIAGSAGALAIYAP